jgi:hypothetical protein
MSTGCDFGVGKRATALPCPPVPAEFLGKERWVICRDLERGIMEVRTSLSQLTTSKADTTCDIHNISPTTNPPPAPNLEQTVPVCVVTPARDVFVPYQPPDPPVDAINLADLGLNEAEYM